MFAETFFLRKTAFDLKNKPKDLTELHGEIQPFTNEITKLVHLHVNYYEVPGE